MPDAYTPSPVTLSGLELKEALAHFFRYEPGNVESMHFLFKHFEANLGVTLEDADVFTIVFKPCVSITGALRAAPHA